MRVLYSALLYLITPLVLLRLLWRGLAQREYWRRWGERFGHVPRVEGGVAAWVHAVSVGESLAALPLIRALVTRHGEGRVLVTTTTPTGSARIREVLGDQVLHTYAPYDLPHVVARFVSRMQPRQVIVMETELWPNLFRALAARRVPLVIANARLSPRSYKGYGRVRGFFAATLADCSAVAAQSEADAQRFIDLGAPRERVSIMGNIKFDLTVPEDQRNRGVGLREQLGAGRHVWIAASTHEDEEHAALESHREVLSANPESVLILVPRHPQRFELVARLVERSGISWARRSAGNLDRKRYSVLLGDSMGEMYMYLAAAEVAFIGGSFVPVGGHNVLEPAALGVPVLFGPHMHNFLGARELLLQAQAAREVTTRTLAETVVTLFRDAAARQAMGAAGQRAVEANRGALVRLLKLVRELPASA